MRTLTSPMAINAALFPAQAITANGNGTAVDLGEAGMDVYAHFNVGTPSTDDTITFNLQESDAASGGTWTAVSLLEGTIPVFAAAGVATVKFLTTKRFVRAQVTVAGSSVSIPASSTLFASRKYR